MLQQIIAPIIKLRGLISSDILVLLALFVIFFLFIIYFKKGRIISLILAYYPSAYLYQTFPYASKLIVLHGDKLVLLNQIGIFLIFFLPLSIIINRYIFSESGYSGIDIFRAFGLSVCCLILALLFSYTIISLDLVHNFSLTIDSYFKSPSQLFWWNIVPLGLLSIF